MYPKWIVGGSWLVGTQNGEHTLTVSNVYSWSLVGTQNGGMYPEWIVGGEHTTVSDFYPWWVI